MKSNPSVQRVGFMLLKNAGKAQEGFGSLEFQSRSAARTTAAGADFAAGIHRISAKSGESGGSACFPVRQLVKRLFGQAEPIRSTGGFVQSLKMERFRESFIPCFGDFFCILFCLVHLLFSLELHLRCGSAKPGANRLICARLRYAFSSSCLRILFR